MLSVLLGGTLTAAPVSRTSSKGSTFVTATLRAAGEDGATVWCSIISFNADAVEVLRALHAGDAVAVAGQAAINHYETGSGEHRVGLRVTVSRVLSIHDAGQRRKRATATAAAGVGTGAP